MIRGLSGGMYIRQEMVKNDPIQASALQLVQQYITCCPWWPYEMPPCKIHGCRRTERYWLHFPFSSTSWQTVPGTGIGSSLLWYAWPIEPDIVEKSPLHFPLVNDMTVYYFQGPLFKILLRLVLEHWKRQEGENVLNIPGSPIQKPQSVTVIIGHLELANEQMSNNKNGIKMKPDWVVIEIPPSRTLPTRL